MATIGVSSEHGIRIDAGITASTVREYSIPKWANYVQVKAPLTGGANLEVAWSGTDGAASSTANEFSLIIAGGTDTYQIPVAKFGLVDVVKLYVRPTSASSTTIEVRAQVED